MALRDEIREAVAEAREYLRHEWVKLDRQPDRLLHYWKCAKCHTVVGTHKEKPGDYTLVQGVAEPGTGGRTPSLSCNEAVIEHVMES